MKTYNVKTVSAMLGKSQSFVMTRAYRANLRPTGELHKRWEFTHEDIEKIKVVAHIKKKSVLRDVCEATGLTEAWVQKLCTFCGLRLKRDYDKVLWACQKYATGFYTKEGIFYLLKKEYEKNISSLQ
jgi:hypothetical protein